MEWPASLYIEKIRLGYSIIYTEARIDGTADRQQAP